MIVRLRPVDGVLVAMAAVAGIFLWRTAAMAGLPFSIDPNEGWNAYFAAAAVDGGVLYPPPESGLTNNYPPLSFYLSGMLGKAVGDAIVAGRIVSLISFAAIVCGLTAAARRLGATWRGALFCPLIFAGGLTVFTDYVGMNDPQLLAHALSLAGLLTVLYCPRRLAWTAAAAGCFVLAFFVKHNIVVAGGATLIWLWFEDRKTAVRLGLCGAAFAAAGLYLFRLRYGIDLWKTVASARTYSFDLLLSGVLSWLRWNALPLIAGAILIARAGGQSGMRFCAIYAATAIATGVIFLGGTGVDANAMFDADMALALACALLLTRWTTDWRQAALAAAVAAPILWGGYAAVKAEDFDSGFILRPGAYSAGISRTDIAFLKAHPGPALCALPSFCYWAGKPFSVDVFNLSERFKTGAARDDELIARLKRREFSVLQFDLDATDVLGRNVEAAVRQYYRLDHADDAGLFFVPNRHGG